jgi:NADPH-dependent 2,4-dienoyl-CoA reductase/sulfur reductase-like enzyme/pSer/pThr/pTyr-binding forkhead associated (FHA) protein
MTEHYMIIGNGIAGMTAAETLRSENEAADITVVADDPFPVYYRPALKDYLAGRVREEKLWARPNSFYSDLRIRFLSERAVGIQAGQHLVQFASGRQIGYSRLLLASGARAARLACPGIDLAGVTTLRTVADYQAVQARLAQARRIVVSGSGTLALETIETLRHRGYAVTHLLRKRTLWSEILDQTASDLVLQQERRDGVEVRIEEEIAEITGKNGQVTGVITTNGARIACELVIIAIGVEPIIDFIQSSGIPCGRGVKVDRAMRTQAPDVFAAGDVLQTTDSATGRVRVIGQWYPAVQQARAAAYSMLGLLQDSRAFIAENFYNATFLYGLDFASVGLTQMPRERSGFQEIVAEPRPREYRKALLKQGVPVGMLALGDRKSALAFKRAIDHSIDLSPVASRLFASDFKLGDWLDKQGVPPPVLSVSKESLSAGKRSAQPAQSMADRQQALLIPVEAGAASSKEVRLNKEQVMKIGRQAGVFLLIDHPSVSRLHADIRYEQGKYLLRDCGSSNGTFIDDTRLNKDSPVALEAGQGVRFGHVNYTFQLRPLEQAAQAGTVAGGTTYLRELATGFFDPAAAGPVPAASYQPVLDADGSLMLPGARQPIPASTVATFNETPTLVALLNGVPRLLPLKQGKRYTIGRDKQNDLALVDIAASRLHAEVIYGANGISIRDLESSNGVQVNATKIDNPYHLVHCDRILIGSTPIYFLHTLADDEPGKNITPRSNEIGSMKEATQCPQCGAANLVAARFCANCGTPLRRDVPVAAQGR